MFTEGALLLERVAADAASASDAASWSGTRSKRAARHQPARSRPGSPPAGPRGRRACSRGTRCASWSPTEGPFPVFADRQRALYGSWYEFFPRSEGATVDPETGRWAAARFADRRRAARRRRRDGLRHHLPAADAPDRRAQPQGPQQHRSTPQPDDAGSPWAIGSAEGGHDAIHPDLGTFDDFDAFVAARASSASRWRWTSRCSARRTTRGSTEHPEWFTTRADGTIAYAENPPKKYQDIYPLNFDNDPDGIYREVLRVVKVWISHGVTRVPGRQPAHQAGRVLGVADRRGGRGRTPRWSCSPRRSPARR